MSTVFDQRLFNVGDHVYAMCASVNNPYIYLRFKCVVINTAIKRENVIYGLQILEILETKETIQTLVHRQEFRVQHTKADRGQLKCFNCFELLLDWSTFQSKFKKKFQQYSIILPSVFVHDTEADLNDHVEKSITIMKTHLHKALDQLSVRRL